MTEKYITLPYLEIVGADQNLLMWFSEHFFFGGKYTQVLNCLIDQDLFEEAIWIVKNIDILTSMIVDVQDVLRKGYIITPYFLRDKNGFSVEGSVIARQGIHCIGGMTTRNGDIWTLGEITCSSILTNDLYVNQDFMCYGRVTAKSIIVGGNIEAIGDTSDIETIGETDFSGKILARSIRCEASLIASGSIFVAKSLLSEQEVRSGGFIRVGGNLKAELSIFANQEIHVKGNIVASDFIESNVELVSGRSIRCSDGSIESGGGIYAKGSIFAAYSISAACNVVACNYIESDSLNVCGVVYSDINDTGENIEISEKMHKVFLARTK